MIGRVYIRLVEAQVSMANQAEDRSIVKGRNQREKSQTIKPLRETGFKWSIGRLGK